MESASQLASLSAPEAGARRSLFVFAVVVVIAVLALIKVGAMVTSTNSGLAYISWPLADGEVWPANIKAEGKYEMGHRYFGALIGLLSVALALALWFKERRAWLRWLAIGLVGVVSIQGAIGAIGVFENLPVLNSSTHGVLAQVILCTFTLIAFALSPAWEVRHRVAPAAVSTSRKLTTFALALVFAQVVVGALVRHGNGQALLWTHVLMALFVALAILIAAAHAAGRFEQDTGFQKLLRYVLVLILVQIGLGFATLAVRGGGKWTATPEQIGRALTISGHVACGALTMLLATLLCVKAWRNLEASDAPR